jgi:hypothetical protein
MGYFKSEKDFGGYSVKGIKIHKGHEGEDCIQCSVYKDGKRIGLFSEDDWGGPARLHFKNQNDEQELREFAKKFLKETYSESYHIFINNICNERLLRDDFKKKCKTIICFVTPAMGKDEYSYYNRCNWQDQNTRERITAKIFAEHPDAIIINAELESLK